MAEYKRIFLDSTTTAVQWGTPVQHNGLRDMFFELILDTTAATFSGDVVFTVGIEAGPRYDNPVVGALVAVTAAPTGWTLTNGIQVVWSNPASGTTRMVLRYANPPRLISPYYTYNSGGGTPRIRINAWGFGVNPTP